MTLIKTVEKANGFIMRTYKSQRNGRITHILEPQGVVKGKRAIFCDKFENPQKVIIATKNKQKEIYEKAPDGSTIMKIGEKITNLPHLIFNKICENLLK